jgi:hypothetical protein
MKRAVLSVMCAVVALGWVTTSASPSVAGRHGPTAAVPAHGDGFIPAELGQVGLLTASMARLRLRPAPPTTTTTTVPRTTTTTTTVPRTTTTTAAPPSTTAPHSAAAPPSTTAPPTTAAAAPATDVSQPSGYGCAAAIAYLDAHAAPGFTFECPGNSLGHQAMTCINVPGVCPGEKLIAITDPCPAAYMNEASNSYSLQHLSDAPIDPYGYCS